jgi:hypothetical protein
VAIDGFENRLHLGDFEVAHDLARRPFDGNRANAMIFAGTQRLVAECRYRADYGLAQRTEPASEPSDSERRSPVDLATRSCTSKAVTRRSLSFANVPRSRE